MPSITLGTIGVTPLEMASAYSTLAAGGIYSKPMAITRVVLPNGRRDTDAGWGKPQRERVIPDWVAATVTQVLRQNMLDGTGRGAHVYNHTDAGKTGTTENYADGWFCGYTPRLSAAVWIGYPQGEVPMLDVHGTIVSGPGLPATVWHTFMTSAIGKRPDVPFAPAQTPPVWTSWRGQWEFSGAYGSSSSTATDTSSSTAPANPASTRQSPTTVAQPQATTAAPPPVTTAPPPTTTTTEPPLPLP